jgi:two-component system chemotaxis response regulator CheB
VSNAPPRVLVVDDSARSRALLAGVLEDGGCDVVGRAPDGGLALRMAIEREPDVITCDLEMPRMDGFTFIRLLQSQRPTPIIVVTSDARPEAALQALDLGARDFVVKPSGALEDLRQLGPTLIAKINALTARDRAPEPVWVPPPEVDVPAATPGLVAIGASTGGPGAVRDIFGQFLRAPLCPIVIAQHMPARFTEAFADRLARSTGFDVREATHGETLNPGAVRVAPGGRHLEVTRVRGLLVCEIHDKRQEERWAPSVDRLLSSCVDACGSDLLGVVLTGMGRDGAEGALKLGRAGAPLWCESPATAVIDGMPDAAAESHGRAARLPLDHLAQLVAMASGAGAPSAPEH